MNTCEKNFMPQLCTLQEQSEIKQLLALIFPEGTANFYLKQYRMCQFSLFFSILVHF